MISGASPPASICILRLSALGDVTHVLPIIHTLQTHWPQTKITWIIGKFEYQLVHDLPGVEFAVFDKARGWRAYADLRRMLKSRKFDVLLHMQVALRANLAASLISAPVKVGYDHARAKDWHGMFVNRRIGPGEQHVVDAFFGFLESIGLTARELSWQLPIPEEARAFANQHVDASRRTLVISPCSSHVPRDWSATSYASVADYAMEQHDMQVILCGGPSRRERDVGAAIANQTRQQPLNLIGKDTLKRLLALLSSADVLITPDSGPAHLATCVDTPVIGLYAASNPRRSGPYRSGQWCVDKYAEAATSFLGRSSDQIPWGTKIERQGVMDLISPADVIAKLDAVVSAVRK